jgi:hypothetical protein
MTQSGHVRSEAAHIPSSSSAQCNTVRLFKNSTTLGSMVAGRSCGSTTVATIMSQRSLKTRDMADLPGRLRAVSAYPRLRDRPAGAERGNLAADKIKVAHPIEVVVICDPGCAIAGAELGTEIELKFGAAVGCLARKCATSSPLVDREWPLYLRPDRTRGRAFARHLARRPRCGKHQIPSARACESRRQRKRHYRGLRHSSSPLRARRLR